MNHVISRNHLNIIMFQIKNQRLSNSPIHVHMHAIQFDPHTSSYHPPTPVKTACQGFSTAGTGDHFSFNLLKMVHVVIFDH